MSRNPAYTVSCGGPAGAWQIWYLPLGYGPTPDDRVVWSRPIQQGDFDASEDERYPPGVQEALDEFQLRQRIAIGFEAEAARLMIRTATTPQTTR